MDLNNKTVRDLFRLTLRVFYPPACIVIFDHLLEYHIMSEQDLRSKLKLLTREFNKLIVPLKNDRFVKNESTVENNADGRPLMKQVYFIDPYETHEVIKYKIFTMGRRLEADIKMLADNQVFICPGCNGKEIPIIEAQSNIVDYKFICTTCGSELSENRSAGNPHEVYKKMVEDCAPIVELLKQLSGKKITPVDYFQALENRKKAEGVKDIKEKVVVQEEVEEKSEEFGFTTQEIEEVPLVKECINVNVAGVPKSLSEITEEDMDKMTESEYEKYFELHNIDK